MGKTSKVLGKSGYSLDVQIPSGKNTMTEGPVSSANNTGMSRAEGETVSARVLQHPPKITTDWDERLTKVASFSSKTAESFRVLRSKILLPQDGRPAPKTIMVTSALPREGKSFVSANLGIALAQGVDEHSLLVDCDLRVPSLAKLFGVPCERGLVDYLQGRGDVSDLLQKTSMEKLSILASGLPPANPAELLGSARMENLVAELAGRYPDRYVIFDTPPFEVASESKVLAQAVDGVVLVVRQGVSARTLIEKIISEIGRDKIIGVIFNGRKSNFISNRLVSKNHYYDGYYYSKEGRVGS
ncbi:MAG: polysaccharide biosynthesis tyrosine autokinase [Desulfobulbaceae bacterium]|nr:polysaccharide biosynthesis tyrosine autokinase [Desulfobulbaceae bacterium]